MGITYFEKWASRFPLTSVVGITKHCTANTPLSSVAVIDDMCGTRSKWTRNQQWTENELIRRVVNGSSSDCMRHDVWAFTESNMRTPIPSHMSHITVSLPSILFFYFHFIRFQSNSHSTQNASFQCLAAQKYSNQSKAFSFMFTYRIHVYCEYVE